MLSISICIPCIQPHIPFLGRCIKSIYEQIHLPQEVIISISSVTDLFSAEDDIEKLLKPYRNKLDILVLYTQAKKYAGENRNMAIENSTCDIISMIDADDMMYPNRLYILHKIFTYYPNCIGILHWFNENHDENDDVEWSFNENDIKPYLYSEKIHYGHPSFRASIFKEFMYSDSPRRQDFDFIESILPKYFDNLLVYEQPLTNYISNDSTLYNSAISALCNLNL